MKHDDDFIKNGFLSSDISLFIDEVHTQFREWHELLNDINRYSQQCLHELEINHDKTQEIIVALLYKRTLKTYQATLIVAEKGMMVQAEILLRGMLESLFSLVATSKSEDFIKKYMDSDEVERVKKYNKAIRSGQKEIRKQFTGKTEQAIINDVENNIKEQNIIKLSVEDICRKADMHDWYSIIYPQLSDTAHASIRSLDPETSFNSKGDISVISNPPSHKHRELLYVASAEGMLFALGAVQGIFKISTQSFIEDYAHRIKKLAEKN